MMISKAGKTRANPKIGDLLRWLLLGGPHVHTKYVPAASLQPPRISSNFRIGRNTKKGFTLFELLVTIALAAMATTVVVSQMGRMLDWELKGASRKLSRTIRYLYNKAATENITIRLVLNLDESSYHVEASSDPVSLVHEETGERETKNDDQQSTNDEEKEVIRPKEPSFNPTESYLLKPVKLPGGVYFKDVYTEHQIERLSKGVAYLYFFPQGYVERAVIHLRDEADETHYSLQVNPISGNVSIEPKYREPEIKR